MMGWVLLTFFLLVLGTHGKTDQQDVAALGVMYTSLNSASQLKGWKSSGGDPCGDNWKGITCEGSSVTEIRLSGLGLTGSMGYQLANLDSVTYFDLSKNNLKGDIPYQLPPNVQRIDLSKNAFTGSIPYSISNMKGLKYVNLGHNQLKGPVNDMFGQLRKLTFLDLSYNRFSGNLPQSIGTLSNLKSLLLQNNQLTGSVNVLGNLPLDELNIENNKFTGSLPNKLKDIDTIHTGGNSWSSSSSNVDRTGNKASAGDGSSLGGAAIAGIVVGVLLLILVFIIALFAARKNTASSSSSHFLDDEKLSQQRSFTPLVSHELSNESTDFKDMNLSFQPPPPPVVTVKKSPSVKNLQKSPSVKNLQKSPSVTVSLKPLKPPPAEKIKPFNDTGITNRVNVKRNPSIRTAVAYTSADLQAATGNFATGRLLGEGSIGRVYRAKYADGKVLAVKKLDSSLLQNGDAEDFTKMVSSISKLHNPNIAELVGYCAEPGFEILIYEYFRNGSLHDFLHCSGDYSKPLTWNTRIWIALGTARAVEYLHEGCSPSTVHKNIKSANILLDNELNPRLSDCGLATFHQRTSQNLGAGYNAPECTKPSAYTPKSDVYSFGVVMLELLSGRKPLDRSKPKSEQALVLWATPQLHDIDALGKMVDPALRGLYPPKSLSRFADVIALCVQREPEFRPPMSEVVEALVRLVQLSSMNKRVGNLSGISCVTTDSDQDDY